MTQTGTKREISEKEEFYFSFADDMHFPMLPFLSQLIYNSFEIKRLRQRKIKRNQFNSIYAI